MNMNTQVTASGAIARLLANVVVEQALRTGWEVESDGIRETVDEICNFHNIGASEDERVAACKEAERLWLDRQAEAEPKLVSAQPVDHVIGLCGKGVATFVAIYRYTKHRPTRRVASHMLKETLISAKLMCGSKGSVAAHDQRAFSLVTAAGLRLIARVTSDDRAKRVASEAGRPIEESLGATGEMDMRRLLNSLADNWYELLTHTPEMDYHHAIPLDSGPFIAYVADAELAMRAA